MYPAVGFLSVTALLTSKIDLFTVEKKNALCYFKASLMAKWTFWTRSTYTARMHREIDFVKLGSEMLKI